MAKQPSPNKDYRLSNETRTITSQCKIVAYPWAEEDLINKDNISDAQLSASSRLDISSQLINCNFSKQLGAPSGSFTFTLSNSPGIKLGDWKNILKRGTWCVIYMSQDGDLVINKQVGEPLAGAKKEQEAKKIRCIGFIDRVAVKATLDDRGAFDVNYEVSGRDFGVVYEDTSIWHNTFQYDKILLDNLANNKLNVIGDTKLDSILDTVHDLFYNPINLPGAKTNDNKSLLSIALQWLLPRNMVLDVFGSAPNTAPFWGDLDIKNFSKTAAGLSVEKPTDYLSGNAWQQLKRISVPQFHELFTETTDDGKPQLTFRPIPFAIDKKKYPTVGNFITDFKDLEPLVEVGGIDVLNFDAGEDNHGRYNSFLTTVSTGLINVEDNISILKDSGFPFFNQASIKRYGFRPMHTTVDSIIKNAQKDNGNSDRKTLIEFNEVMKDYWENHVFAESGNAQLIGRNDVKIGKVMRFLDNVPYLTRKRYYIEGYSDTFEVGERGEKAWTQQVMLTRGFEDRDLKEKKGFEERNDEFSQAGEFTVAGGGSTKKGDN